MTSNSVNIHRQHKRALPMFAGIYAMGAGLGPASDFLYSGPALALLLAGPALSLPSILVIYKIIGTKKTFVFGLLTAAMSSLVGLTFGMVT